MIDRFVSVTAGNNTGFEEASRALFLQDIDPFGKMIEKWLGNIRNDLFTESDAFDNVSEGSD